METTDTATIIIIKGFLATIRPVMGALYTAAVMFPKLNKLTSEIATLEEKFNSPSARANQRNQRDQVDVIFGDEEIPYNDGRFDDVKSYRVFLLNRILKTYPGMVYSVEEEYPQIVNA